MGGMLTPRPPRYLSAIPRKLPIILAYASADAAAAIASMLAAAEDEAWLVDEPGRASAVRAAEAAVAAAAVA
jgi:hypothetical protein